VIAIVVAHSDNGCIGRDGDLPWRLPSDLKRFRELTVGSAVVMGRKTYESLPPRFRPLPERRNLVLSTDPSYRAEGAEVFGALDAALDASGERCFVIGGGETYRQALPLATRVYATRVEGAVDGDAFFPALPEDEWRLVERDGPYEENDHRFAFETYDRAG
jgi:dihydrofolate reductase